MRFESSIYPKVGIIVILLALLLSSVAHENKLSNHSGKDEKSQGRVVIEVGEGYEYQKIQAGIDAAPANSLIRVHPGEYYENLIITKSLDIRGMNSSEVILYPPERRSESRAPRILITSATPTTTEGLTIEDGGTGWDDYAVKIQDGNGHVIRNCVLKNCKQGIWVHSESDDSDLVVENIVIEQNNFENVAGHGVYLQGTTGCIVEKNSFTDCGDGVMVAWNSSTNTINDNDFVNCQNGCVFTNHSSDNTVVNNRFEDCNYGIFIEDGSPEINGNSFTSISEFAIYGVLKKAISDNELVDVTNGIIGYVADDIVISNNVISCDRFSALALNVAVDAELTMENNVIDHTGSTPALGIVGGDAISLSDLVINTTDAAIHVENSVGVRIIDSRLSGDLISSTGTVTITGVDGIEIENVNITGGDGLCLISDSEKIKMTSVEMFCGGGDGLRFANSSDITLIDLSLSGILDRGVAFDRCVNAQLSKVKVDSAELGFEFTGQQKEHFIHSVGSNCSTNGNYLYYYTSVTGQKFTHPEAGQVILADTVDCTLENCDLSGNDGILVAYSSGTTISDCRLNRTRYGLKVIQSQDLSVENTVVNSNIDYPGNLLVNGSSISVMDSRFSAPPGMKAVLGCGSSTIDMYNSTYSSLDVESDGGSVLREFWKLSLELRYSDNFTPVMGADILIRSDSKDVYNTIMYNGNDPKTDIWGHIPPVWFLSREFVQNNSPGPLIPVEVCAYFRGEREWDNASVHYLDNNSHLYLVTSDIRRPPGVEITGLSPVEGKDALLVSWNESNEYQDEISLFRLFIWGDGDGTPGMLEISGDDHQAILNATEYGFIHNETYNMNIIAVDGAGFESDPSTIKNVVHKDYFPPESPLSLFNETPGANNVTISWSKSVSMDTRGYRLYMGKKGTEVHYLLTGEYDNLTNYTTIRGLRFETNYTLYVVAFDEANNTSPPGMMLNITTGRSKGTLMLIVVDSDGGKMLERVYAEIRDINGRVWNITTTEEPYMIPLYGGKFLINVSLDNYTDNTTIFNITHENLTRLVLEMIRVADPLEEDDDDIPDDGKEIGDDDIFDEQSENAENVMAMPSWFIVFVVIILILLLLLVVVFLRRRQRHKSRIKVIRYVGPPAMLPSPLPPRPPSFHQSTTPPSATDAFVPVDPSQQAGTLMAPATMYPYGPLLERPALPPYTGDDSHAPYEITDPNAASEALGLGPFPKGSLDEIFQFQNVPSGAASANATDTISIPPPPRIIPYEEKMEKDGVTMNPLPPMDIPGGDGTAALKASNADEGLLGKEEVMSKLKSLIETINKKDNSGPPDEPLVKERSISDITVTLPPDDVSENDVVTTTEPANPPPPEP